jgi:Tol biopolymer transport system component
MDFAACPKCGAMNAPDADSCSACKSPLDAVPDAPAIVLKAEPEPPPAEPAAFPAPPAFEAAPEVRAKIAALEADIAKRPQAKALYLQLVQIYLDAKRPDLAEAVLRRGLALDPANPTFRHRLGQLTGRPEAKVAIAGVTDGAAAPSRPADRFAPVALASRPPRPAPRPAPRGGRGRGRMVAIAAALIAVAVGVKLVVFPSTRRLVAGDFRATSPVWSPTGKHLAFVLTDARASRLAVYDFKTGAHTVAGETAAWDGAGFSWSPDGLRLAYAAPPKAGEWSGSIHVLDLATGQSKRLAPGSSPVWRAGGALLAVCDPELPEAGDGYGDESVATTSRDFSPRYCRIDPDTGAVTRTALAADHGMTLSPLLDRVVFERYAELAGDPAAAAPGGDGEFQSMADAIVAGKAENVAQGTRDLGREVEARRYMEKRNAAKGAQRLPFEAEVFAADVDRGEPVRLAAPGEAAYARWTDAGDRILFAANGASGIEFWTMREDGSDRQAVLRNVKVYDPASVRLSPDGKDVFFVAPVDADAGVARMMTGEDPADLHVAPAGGGAPRRLANKHSFKHRYAVSPDGKRIAYEVLEDVKMIGGEGRSEIWVMSR